MLASDVMTMPAIGVGPSATVNDAAKVMSERRVSALPVVNESGDLVGIVSEGDLFRRAETETRSQGSWWLELLSHPSDHDMKNLRETATLVSSVMRQDVISVSPSTPLDEIADTLEKHRIKRVPVVDDGKVIGVVSRADLVKVLANTPLEKNRTSKNDRSLRDDVIAALGELHSIHPPEFNVIVEGGEVSIWGLLHSEERRRPVIETIKNVPGVIHVHDRLALVPAWYFGE